MIFYATSNTSSDPIAFFSNEADSSQFCTGAGPGTANAEGITDALTGNTVTEIHNLGLTLVDGVGNVIIVHRHFREFLAIFQKFSVDYSTAALNWRNANAPDAAISEGYIRGYQKIGHDMTVWGNGSSADQEGF